MTSSVKRSFFVDSNNLAPLYLRAGSKVHGDFPSYMIEVTVAKVNHLCFSCLMRKKNDIFSVGVHKNIRIDQIQIQIQIKIALLLSSQ